MTQKFARPTQRSFQITDAEKASAREAMSAFKKFIGKLQVARQADKKLVDVLEKNPETDAKTLFDKRHLLRKYQEQVKNRYTKLIYEFSGKKDIKGNLLEQGIIHTLEPLSNDTVTNNIKSTIQDSMQQLVEFLEEFLEKFEDYNNPNIAKEIVQTSKKADQIIQSLQNVVNKQMAQHFEKNILGRTRVAQIISKIHRRGRLIDLLVK